MKTDWETLVPVLVHIQANLEGNLSLRALGKKAGLSPFHLQRLFKAAVGETPKTYTLRLRLERAAFRLTFHETNLNLLDLALECGFQNHESFARGFRRRFDCTPSEYRGRVRRRAGWWSHQSRQILDDPARQFEISSTKVVQLRPTHLAFTCHAGPYESVPQSLFDELEQWAARRRMPGPPVWMGIGHDSPATTPPERLRFDAAMRVDAPFAPEGRIAYQLLPGGHFAVTTHVEPYDTLPSACGAIFPRLMQLAGYQIIGLPAVEIYHTSRVNIEYDLNHTSAAESAGA
jgi:AraC family transcriptional regulator